MTFQGFLSKGMEYCDKILTKSFMYMAKLAG